VESSSTAVLIVAIGGRSTQAKEKTMPRLRSSASLALIVGLVAGCGGAVDGTGSATTGLGFRGRKAARIAVVGAGPSGLTAAYTLQQLGYQNVTVFDKNDYVGGKVRSYHNGSKITELGAVFASPDYTLVLNLANKFNIPYVTQTTSQLIVDEQGNKLAPQAFLTSRYSLPQILAATVAYGAALTLFSGDQNNGFAWQLPDLYLPFDQFAAKYGFTPIAELIKAVMIGFGYGFYETTPAIYYMKLMPWLVKIGGPQGLQSATYYSFPTGYQSLWQAVAQTLNVKLNSEVTSITRNPLSANPIHLVVNHAEAHDFDAVIISAPLHKVQSFVALSDDEKALFANVQSERYIVDVFNASGLTPEEVLFLYPNATASALNHASVWANVDKTVPYFVGYQIVDWGAPETLITDTLAGDIAAWGGGQLGGVLLRQEWDYFPHVTSSALAQGFYERVEALQGWSNTFYVGGTLSFETVEHSARYAQELVYKNFPPALF
jgi:predicted NAD/FAD-dependent oxidoreductase